MTPIYVASRGRPGARLLRLLREHEVEHRVFVEPHERTAYLAGGARRSQIVELPERDRGLAFVRQHILDYARDQGDEWYWNLDDDISGFVRVVAGRNVKVTPQDALAGAEAHFRDREDCGQAALEYQQYAWRAAQPYVEASYCDVAVAVRTSVPASFRPETNLKVDRDFTLQVLASGATTIRVTEFAFSAPTMGSNAGGLRDEYLAGREQADSETLARLWPGIAEVVTKPNGRVDARIRWRAARPEGYASRR